jgi:hypothetical protein
MAPTVKCEGLDEVACTAASPACIPEYAPVALLYPVDCDKPNAPMLCNQKPAYLGCVAMKSTEECKNADPGVSDGGVTSTPPGTGDGVANTPPGTGDGGKVCTAEAKLCPDGKTSVGRTGPNCEFAACPTTSGTGGGVTNTPPGTGDGGKACTREAKLCPDGKSYVGRTGPNCEFAPCPK